MANTYTQIYIHFVFVVKNRDAYISPDFKEVLHKYITGIVKNKKQKMLAINSMPNHMHIFIGWEPCIHLPDLVKIIKSQSSAFINSNKLSTGKFRWQIGYGAFSYAKSQKKVVINYIENQERHHASRTLKEEYVEMLEKFEVDYDNRYLFDFLE